MADRILGAIALVLSAVIAFSTHSLTFLRNGVPGAGMLPILLAGFIALCGLWLLFSRDNGEKPNWPEKAVLLRIVGAFGVLGLYTALVPILGFAIVTGIFLVILVWWWGSYPWWVPPLSGILGAVMLSYLFSSLLGVPLPIGIWG